MHAYNLACAYTNIISMFEYFTLAYCENYLNCIYDNTLDAIGDDERENGSTQKELGVEHIQIINISICSTEMCTSN